MEGLSGWIQFDENGDRTNFTIDIVQTTMNSEMAKVAEWDLTHGLVVVPAKYHRVATHDTNLDNTSYIVTSILVNGMVAQILTLSID